MQCRRIEAESITHNYYNSSMKPKFYKNTRLVGKIIGIEFLLLLLGKEIIHLKTIKILIPLGKRKKYKILKHFIFS